MPTRSQFHIAVIGGGPAGPMAGGGGAGAAGLRAAEVLVGGGTRVTVYDPMPTVGRKFLLAGRGGLNLTHSEDLARLLGRYGAAEGRLGPALPAVPGGGRRGHSEDLARLLGRYGAAEARLRPAIEAFPPAALRAWCEALGQETFVGSSGRVFPVSMKT